MATGLGESFWNVLKGARAGSEAMSEFEEHLDVLDNHLARRAFLAGDYSIADTLATPLLDLLERVEGLDLDGYHHVVSWRARLRSRPSYRGVWPSEKVEKEDKEDKDEE